MAGPGQPVSVVHLDAVDLARDVTIRGSRDVDERPGVVAEPVQERGCPVAGLVDSARLRQSEF